jgi:two-component system capsular synthesis response regulator RcsB
MTERDSAQTLNFLFDMFKKIIIAEDFDTYSIAIGEALKTLTQEKLTHVSYCDEALNRIKKGMQDNAPYDLLISDLSFKPDHRKMTIQSGVELISQAKKMDPDLRVIVYSIENRMHPIRHLFDELGIDAYVLKGRNNIPELRKAIQIVFEGERYRSEEVSLITNNRSLEEIESYDILLLELLAKGISQSEISGELQKVNIAASSKSSVEKRLNRLKAILGANNNIQLIVIAKDLGLI